MAANWLKNWVQGNLGKLAVNRARSEIQNTGRALPCSVVAVNGSLVTVKFEVNAKPWTLPQITIPIANSRWIRDPIQPGDPGVTMPADVYLGGITGMGGGVASMAQPGNLSALVFVPTGAKNFSSVNTNAAYIAGPEGAVIETEDGTSSIVVNEYGITLTFGAKVVVLNGEGLTIDGVLFDTHTHLYAPGSGSPVPTEGPES